MNTFELGNHRYVTVCEWKGEKRADLREWDGNKPTKKGISLPLIRWKGLVDCLDDVDEAIKSGQAYQNHLGGNVFCSVKERNPRVDIRQYWKPENDVVPCRKGLCLRPAEYEALKTRLPDITQILPELDSVGPCALRHDHMNQLGALRCAECNPNHFMNWNVERDSLSFDEILTYSRELGRDWQLFMTYLGYKSQQIEDAKRTHPCQLTTLLYMVIKKWYDVVVNFERENPKWLLAAAFSAIGDNRTASKIFGERVFLKEVSTLKLNSDTECEIHRITF